MFEILLRLNVRHLFIELSFQDNAIERRPLSRRRQRRQLHAVVRVLLIQLDIRVDRGHAEQ